MNERKNVLSNNLQNCNDDKEVNNPISVGIDPNRFRSTSICCTQKKVTRKKRKGGVKKKS